MFGGVSRGSRGHVDDGHAGADGKICRSEVYYAIKPCLASYMAV